jgi:hypothetical protein
MPAAKPKTEKLDRRQLAEELLTLHRKHAETFGRMDDIKAALRKFATEGGENFKEEFAGKGVVKVSGGHAAVFKGILPEVNVETFLGLPDKARTKLVDDGIVKMNPTYGKPYYGSVTVEAF